MCSQINQMTQSFAEFFTEIHRENYCSVPLCAFSVALCVEINAGAATDGNLRKVCLAYFGPQVLLSIWPSS